MRPTAVTIATICPGALRAECARALLAAASAGYNVEITTAPPYLDAARNDVIERFLATRREWLVFIDADISFHPSDIDRLVTTDQTVVAGVYAAQYETGFATSVFARHGERFAPLTAEELWELPRHDGLIRVDSVGAGCLAAHRSVLERMRDTYPAPTPWFVEPAADGLLYGEDHGFAMRVASLDLGPWAHPKVLVAHHKTIAITVPKESFHVAV